MALELKISIQSIAADCGIVTFCDTTGDYDAATNPGGYGAPNEAFGDIVQRDLIFVDAAGNQYELTDITLDGDRCVQIDWNSLVPVGEAVSEESDPCGCGSASSSVDLGLADSVWPDGCMNITYNVYSDAGITLVATASCPFWFDCQISAAAAAAIKGDCQTPEENMQLNQDIQELLGWIERGQLIFVKLGCDCAQKALTKANSLAAKINTGSGC